ncbi:1-pyrroline-5-carboxylate dehydrogenase [Nocardia sp. RB20]|uniref:1-pyrroline-5-carboxylate dehydrogenase n=1 Tax=Nocardia macrotermitis TaxID=2585198 RepID=A0A7K0CZV0_9NOCA|nr:1-pyrroline-5-carboxylate dehydrogenase [Nocardia macrotermitis]
MQSGQSCACASRILVHESVYDRFLEKFVAAVESAKIGDPFDPAVAVGPVIGEQDLLVTPSGSGVSLVRRGRNLRPRAAARSRGLSTGETILPSRTRWQYARAFGGTALHVLLHNLVRCGDGERLLQT